MIYKEKSKEFMINSSISLFFYICLLFPFKNVSVDLVNTLLLQWFLFDSTSCSTELTESSINASIFSSYLSGYLCTEIICSNTLSIIIFTFFLNFFILSSYDLFIPTCPYASAIYILYRFLHKYWKECFQDEKTKINLDTVYLSLQQKNYKELVFHVIKLMCLKQFLSHLWHDLI
jgi:hypothetical protein